MAQRIIFHSCGAVAGGIGGTLAEAMQSGEVTPENLAAALLPKPGKQEIAAKLLDETAIPPETDRTRLLDRLAGNEFSESEIRAISKLVDNMKGGGKC